MGQRPTQGDEKSLRPATTLYRTVALSFVIPSEAEGSAVPRTLRGHVFRESAPGFPATQLLDMATCAAFVKESRMKIANATKLNRKSGVAEWRDLQFSFSDLTRTILARHS